ncbi:hypothetical protein [uncultured Pseudacidovorax sp.]|uniref:hypothetical protein n=1 Tax=uncultured Pseudacidovorax sp. TaxID=679313 RepID=UPI0025CE63A8|nr:hypothetical protein [uncultured Pseudacidovorax sp.]
MANKVSICSAALLQFGKDPINSFEEDNDRARLCSNLYPVEADSLLRENDWNCSLQRVVLAPMATPPAYGFAAQFELPGDFLRLVAVADARIDSPACRTFKVEGRRILASGTALPITYVFRSDESVWDSKLVELMIARMLWKLAYPVTASTSLRDELRGEYQRLATLARAVDSQENPSQSLSDDYTLLDARG